MTGITKVSEKMKKKMSFGDYTLSNEEPNTLEKKLQKGRKVYLLTKEDMNKLKEIGSKRVHSDSQTSIAELMSEAIGILYRLVIR